MYYSLPNPAPGVQIFTWTMKTKLMIGCWELRTSFSVLAKNLQNLSPDSFKLVVVKTKASKKSFVDKNVN